MSEQAQTMACAGVEGAIATKSIPAPPIGPQHGVQLGTAAFTEEDRQALRSLPPGTLFRQATIAGAQSIEMKVRSRLAQHLQEPHSPIRLKASDVAQLLEEPEAAREQVGRVTHDHVVTVAGIQGQLDTLREEYSVLEESFRTAAIDAAQYEIERNHARQERDEAQQSAREILLASRRRIRRLQRELKKAGRA